MIHEMMQGSAFSILVYVIIGIASMIGVKGWTLFNVWIILISILSGFALAYLIP